MHAGQTLTTELYLKPLLYLSARTKSLLLLTDSGIAYDVAAQWVIGHGLLNGSVNLAPLLLKFSFNVLDF